MSHPSNKDDKPSIDVSRWTSAFTEIVSFILFAERLLEPRRVVAGAASSPDAARAPPPSLSLSYRWLRSDEEIQDRAKSFCCLSDSEGGVNDLSRRPADTCRDHVFQLLNHVHMTPSRVFIKT
ncbi:hypothetical protein EVAR_18185_1 [Eumeta japonica]|uniref:Uncharacterized protein n=1 Tax=Eumeta variegata TaxID=151549 RepID=A0A4C1UWJ3_EUMVA|nr:hypothetical protein EVAR_18185_1 [Eumeta japonica]